MKRSIFEKYACQKKAYKYLHCLQKWEQKRLTNLAFYYFYKQIHAKIGQWPYTSELNGIKYSLKLKSIKPRERPDGMMIYLDGCDIKQIYVKRDTHNSVTYDKELHIMTVKLRDTSLTHNKHIMKRVSDIKQLTTSKQIRGAMSDLYKLLCLERDIKPEMTYPAGTSEQYEHLIKKICQGTRLNITL